MSFKKISNYIIHLNQSLGRGSYGEVFKGQHDQSQKICAIKVLSKKKVCENQYLKKAFLQEIDILKQVKSTNIVTVYEIMQSTNNYYIIQQLCNSDLEKYIKENKEISEERAIQILKQIVNGFIALIKQGIIHRDVKPANILISNGVVKIADFGFAKKNVAKKMMNQTVIGTPLYMSPELLKGESYSSKCDIWGVSLIFYELLHKKTPWFASSVYQLVKRIQENPLVINPSLSDKTKDFLQKTLELNKNNRLQWDQVIDHPIFEGHFDHYRINNKKIQDKLKSIMSRLRYKIHSEDINITKLFNQLGFKQNAELNFKEFRQFLNYITTNITQQQIRFFFDKIDQNSSGTISIQEIEREMEAYQISHKYKSKLKSANTINQDQSNTIELDVQLQQKVKKCFQKLHRVLQSKKISLKTAFLAYDKSFQGHLSFQDFSILMSRIDASFTEEDTQTIFNRIDIDHSKTIEFEQLNSFYNKVNKLPRNEMQKDKSIKAII